MSARIYGMDAWCAAYAQRASAGKAPRIAIRRSIVMQETAAGSWVVGIFEWRFGRWQKPTWLCESSPLADARRAALSAWDKHRIPLFWSRSSDKGVRAFHVGIYEPEGARA